jgi:hypothetical protein
MTYYSTRPAEALTNALERLMIAISNQELEQNHVLLCEYRRACDLLGYDPVKAQWSNVLAVNASGLPNDEDHTVDYYPLLNPEE